MRKRKFMKIGGVVVLLLTLLLGWREWVSPTKVAFLNYGIVSLGNMSKANDNSSIKINMIDAENLDDLSSYDMLFINAMGLRITEDQRALIQEAADDGLPVLATSITNPVNDINNIDSINRAVITSYLSNGGRTNARSMLNYVRRHIDKKLFMLKESAEVFERSNDLLYHADPKDRDAEELGFNTIADYNNFLEKNGLYDEKAPRIIVTGMMGEPSDLIRRLEETGNMVYYVRNMNTMIRNGKIDSIAPSAMINMAHGRMGDYIVDYLTTQNIPLFAPLSTGRLVEEWEDEKMGMSGGMLSQSIVTPEIDGALRPFAIYGHFINDDGLQYVKAIPERLESFVETVNNYIGLKSTENSDKRVAIYYFKGAGQNAMTAGGMEVAPSLYNFLLKLKEEGYNVDGLPSSSKELAQIIQKQGAVLGAYAEGAIAEFMENGKPELINKEQYEGWVKKSLRPEKYAQVVELNGEFPGQYMNTDDGQLGLARILFGNIAILPQTAASSGKDSFKILHGVDAVPPHPYIASYLWAQHGFNADILMHFGTHGSLEFTPKKQVALSSLDWPDRLVGSLPHIYIYTVSNVGEGIIAKRRSYAGLQSHLTPPFLESSVRGIYRELMERIKIYNNTDGACTHDHGVEDGDDHNHSHESRSSEDIRRASLAVKASTVKLGIHSELGLDSIMIEPYSEYDILRIENFAEELATEKITGELYTMGVPYENSRITSSVYAMTTDPIAYSIFALDKIRGDVSVATMEHKSIFNNKYLEPAKVLVGRLLARPSLANDKLICSTANITMAELEKARAISSQRNAPKGMMAMMAARSRSKSDKAIKKEYTKEEINYALAIMEIERTINNIANYKSALLESPNIELKSAINAMNGGYTKPSPGGDPIANPNTLPTGRNLFSVDAEMTPSEAAWEKGVQLANSTIELYRRRHNDSLPRKVSYTLWSGEFIETGGATIAQVLYMLGVEPIRDTYGRVSDLRLIPSAELGRPRIDVVVQTSGQLRDLAASRLFLINRAVEMAAAAKEDEYENLVTAGVVEAERALIEKGVTPKDAREMAAFRVFGGVRGGYGTSIQGMVMGSDKWDDEQQIADVYLNNMGAFYGKEKDWEIVRQYAFEAALTRTDVVIHPRQSNSWGALSLDHVYEFMGGLNLAVRSVTGKDPDAYFSDYRNRNNVRIQDLKESIGVESRTTILNPTYIKEKMKGEASSAGIFAATIQNTFAWNVLKPSVIDDRLWDEIHDVYINDKFNLGIKDFFEDQNHAALQEMTAVMLESVRKGMWDASQQQIETMTSLHTELVNKHKAACSGFVCDNAKLREFIASNVGEQTAKEYQENVNKAREAVATNSNDDKSIVMKSDEVRNGAQEEVNNVNNLVVSIVVIIAIIGIILLIRRRKKMQD